MAVVPAMVPDVIASPETFPAVEIVGRSVSTKVRKVGAAATPEEGPAKTVLADWVDKETEIDPLAVSGDPVTLNTEGMVMPTLVNPPADVVRV